MPISVCANGRGSRVGRLIDGIEVIKMTERRLPFQPSVAQTYGNQLLDLIKQKGIPNVTLSADENGHAYIDKEKHPTLYDWAVNG